MLWCMSSRLGINANKLQINVNRKPMLCSWWCRYNNKQHMNWTSLVNEIVELGIYTENRLSWCDQCDKLNSNVAGKVSVVRRIKSFCRSNTLALFFEKTIQLVFSWCHTAKAIYISKLQHAQKYVARSVADHFDDVNFRSYNFSHEYNLSLVKKMRPVYISNDVQCYSRAYTSVSNKYLCNHQWSTWSQYPNDRFISCPISANLHQVNVISNTGYMNLQPELNQAITITVKS